MSRQRRQRQKQKKRAANQANAELGTVVEPGQSAVASVVAPSDLVEETVDSGAVQTKTPMVAEAPNDPGPDPGDGMYRLFLTTEHLQIMAINKTPISTNDRLVFNTKQLISSPSVDDRLREARLWLSLQKANQQTEALRLKREEIFFGPKKRRLAEEAAAKAEAEERAKAEASAVGAEPTIHDLIRKTINGDGVAQRIAQSIRVGRNYSRANESGLPGDGGDERPK